MKLKLLNVGRNAKTVKSDKLGEYSTAVLYLAPSDTVEGIDVCPMAKLAGCREACLYSAGKGALSSVQAGRVRKTRWFRDDKEGFLTALDGDIGRHVERCAKLGVRPAVRLNGTSDILWETLGVPQRWPQVQFYDYTKIPGRRVPANYHLTFSWSALLPPKVVVKARNLNWAVVFRGGLPEVWGGRRVIDGDKHDLRFQDPKGVIVGLKAKGKARTDESGFVVDIGGALLPQAA